VGQQLRARLLTERAAPSAGVGVDRDLPDRFGIELPVDHRRQVRLVTLAVIRRTESRGRTPVVGSSAHENSTDP
jgi:hypothetical protein